MLNEIPRILSATREGVTFGEFFVERSNHTPATRTMIERATLELVQEGQVEVAGADGGKRRVSAAIQDDHVIRIPWQRRFFF